MIPNTKNDIISKSNHKGFLYAGFNKQSLSRIEFDSKEVSKKTRCISSSTFSMENKRYPKRQNENYGVIFRTRRKKPTIKSCWRISHCLGKNKGKFNNSIEYLILLKYLSFFLKYKQYNPIMLNGMKGFKMSKIQIDLRNTATIDDIIDLEKKLLGVRGILDAFSACLEAGVDNSTEALALVRDLITDTIIQKDIEMLKEKVEYMFWVCSDVYHGEVA